MFSYILKRILIFIPTLIAISLLTFMISLSAPGDPVELMLGQAGGDSQLADKMASEKTYIDMREKLRLNLPIFYFSLSNQATSDTLYKIPKKNHRDLLSRLTDQYGNWPEISTYFEQLRDLELTAYKIERNSSNQDALIKVKNYISELFLNHKDQDIQRGLSQISSEISTIRQQYDDAQKAAIEAQQKAKVEADSLAALAAVTDSTVTDSSTTTEKEEAATADSTATENEGTEVADSTIMEDEDVAATDSINVPPPANVEGDDQLASINQKMRDDLGALENFNMALTNTQNAYQTIKDKATPDKLYIPSFKWYGLNNQYHQWFSRFVTGDFGYSYQDKRPIGSILIDRVKWTMLISFLAIIITYIIAIPLGVFSAVRKGTFGDQFSTTILFVLYSLPSFWVATLMIMFFGGGDYFDWFPPYGVGNPPADASIWEVIKTRAYHLFMPLVCWTYGTFAFLSRQMRGGMLSVLRQDYVRTARAKGLSEGKIIWKHAFRNSLIPIITIFANVFPLMISGSVVLEVIFTIPGMGKWGFDAIIFRDYPVVFTVMMFSAILTMIGYLVSDILYAWVDPRISYSK